MTTRHIRRPLARLRARAAALLSRRPSRAVPPRTTPAPAGTDGGGDRLIRGAAVAILLGVAAAAAYVSYHHFYGLARALGERHDMALLYPAMSDGVIVMASLVMVYCSRRGLPVPLLAWVALMVGGVVTLVANVAHGWHGGIGSRLLSALAPVAFVGAYELLMWLVRTGRTVATPPAPEVVERVVYRDREVPVEVVRTELVIPLDRYDAAAREYEQSLAEGGRPVGRRTLASHWGITEREAEQIQAEVRDRRDGTTSEAAPKRPVRWADLTTLHQAEQTRDTASHDRDTPLPGETLGDDRTGGSVNGHTPAAPATRGGGA